MRQHLGFLPLAALLVSQGCVPPRVISGLGTDTTLRPEIVSITQGWRQPPTITFDLARPAHLTLFDVVLNHRAQLLSLGADAADWLFQAGTYQVGPIPARAASKPSADLYGAGEPTGGAYAERGESSGGGGCPIPPRFVSQVEMGREVIEPVTPGHEWRLPCLVPPIAHLAASGPGSPDRYLVVVATDAPLQPEKILGSLAELDVIGSAPEVMERVAQLASRSAGAGRWAAYARRW